MKRTATIITVILLVFTGLVLCKVNAGEKTESVKKVSAPGVFKEIV